MPYSGNDPNLIDLQSQITANLNTANTEVAGVQTQIKQVTLTLEGELTTITTAFAALKAFVQSGGSVAFVTPPATATSPGATNQLAFDTNYFYVCIATNTWKRVSIVAW